jgi:hypothetical protein
MNDAATTGTAATQHHETPALVAALSDSALRRASNSAIFQRGRTCASSGAVDVASEEPGDTPVIRATVTGTGTEPYATEVWIHEGEVGGVCDCANAQEGWFCKHQVAVALIWRERLCGEAPIIDAQALNKVEANPKRAQTLKERQQALKEFLHSQPASVLADRLLGLGDRDLPMPNWGARRSRTTRDCRRICCAVASAMAGSRRLLRCGAGGSTTCRASSITTMSSRLVLQRRAIPWPCEPSCRRS